MGIYRKQLNRIALRLFSLFVLAIIAFFVPWGVVVALAAALTFFEVVSVELIVVGIFLDLFLLDQSLGFFGLFYTIIFFFLNLGFVIVRKIIRGYEEKKKY